MRFLFKRRRMRKEVRPKPTGPKYGKEVLDIIENLFTMWQETVS